MSKEMTVIDAVVAQCPRDVYVAVGQRVGLWWDKRLGAWVAVDQDVVRAVLSHPELAVRPPGAPVPPAFAGTVAGEVFGGFARMSDGAAHRERRDVVVRMLDAITPDDAACAARTVLSGRGAWTLHELQFVAPVMAVGALLGVPPAHWSDLVEWTSRFVRGASPMAGADETAAAIDAAPELARLFEDGGTEIVTANGIGLVFQTHDAVAALVGGAVLALARNGDGDIERAFADAMRDDAPIQNTRRFATSDIRIGEATVRRGDMIVAVLAASGDGERFGHGAHLCPGEHIALAIARETLAFALENGMIPDLMDGPVRYHASGNARIPDLRGEDES